jgi:hypothetical protein
MIPYRSISSNSGVNAIVQEVVVDNVTDVNTTWSSAKIESYISSFIDGLDPKESVKCASTVPLLSETFGSSGTSYDNFNTLTQTTPTNGILTQIDGYTVVIGDRILIKNESILASNGIYICTAKGDGVSVPWLLTRSSDGNQDGELSGGTYTYVESGTLHGGTSFILQADGEIDLTLSEPINFVVYQSSGSSPQTAINTSAISAIGPRNTLNGYVGTDASNKMNYDILPVSDTYPSPSNAIWSTEYMNRILTSKILNIKATSTIIVGTVALVANNNISGTLDPVTAHFTGFTFPLVIDSVTAIDAEYLLLVGQTDERENGIYYYDAITPKLIRLSPIATHYFEGATYIISKGVLYTGSKWYVLPNAPTIINGATMSVLSPIYFSKYDVTDAQTEINKTDITTINSNISNIDNTSDLNKPISTLQGARMSQIEAGITYKTAVVTTSTTPLPNSTYDHVAGTLTATSNGVLSLTVAVVLDRVLIKNQVDLKENGYYVITDIGTVSTQWVLTRSQDANNHSPDCELNGGDVITSISPLEQYVVVGYGCMILNDPILNNNSDVTFSIFGSSVPANLTISTLNTSGAIVSGGALTASGALSVIGAHATTLGGNLTVTGTATLGILASLNVSGIASVGGTGTVYGVFDAKAAVHLRGAVTTYAALTGPTITNLTSRITALEGGGVPANAVLVSIDSVGGNLVPIVCKKGFNPDNSQAVQDRWLGDNSNKWNQIYVDQVNTDYINAGNEINIGGASVGRVNILRSVGNVGLLMDGLNSEIIAYDNLNVQKIKITGQTGLIEASTTIVETGLYSKTHLGASIGTSLTRFSDIFTFSLYTDEVHFSSTFGTVGYPTKLRFINGGGGVATDYGIGCSLNSQDYLSAVDHSFYSANVKKLTIDTSGIVIIGNVESNGVLMINSGPGVAGNANKINVFNGGVGNTYGWGISSASLDHISGLHHTFYSGTTAIFGINTSGIQLHTGTATKAGGGSWSTISSSLVKRNILPVDPALSSSRIMALQVKTYQYNTNVEVALNYTTDKTWLGMIQQDYQSVYPSATPESTIIEIDGVETEVLTMDTTKAQFDMIGALQHAMNTIEAQAIIINNQATAITAMMDRLDVLESYHV